MTRTLETRDDRRRRECKRCRLRVTTCEIIVDDGLQRDALPMIAGTVEATLRSVATALQADDGGRLIEAIEDLLTHKER